MKRRFARECALKVLFMIEMGANNTEQALQYILDNSCDAEQAMQAREQEFCTALVRGVVSKRDELNSMLTPFLINWQLDRLAPVVRVIMYIALFEILYMEDIPPAVTINEAVELSRQYQDEESARFVNAVLDNMRLSREKRD